MRIKLSPVETQFVHHLDLYARNLTPPVDCRIAGGWVRDKLLSLPSNDLDIALSIPSGHSFAVSFVQYLHAQGITTGSVGKVAANPNQSKHLETGTTRILDLECDFVGLRSETYADTRIPTIRPGTPLEDAQRRDLTINALFYNIHTQSVEDFTGQGLPDLANRIARTPLAPIQTFADDPLRVLRCIRFASRYDLTIEPEVVEAIKNPEIQSALAAKVSRERIGIEVNKMLEKTPEKALRMINNLGLHRSVFASALDPPRGSVADYLDILPHLENVESLHWLAAAVSPFDNLNTSKLPATADVISNALKLGNDKRDGVTKLFDAARIIDPTATQRSVIGTMLMATRPWKRSMVWATANAVRAGWTGAWDATSQDIVQQFKSFVTLIERLDLDVDIDKPPFLDGKAIQALLSIKPSPILATILRAVTVWQLDHPEGTREQCESWIKHQWTEEWSQQPVVGKKKK